MGLFDSIKKALGGGRTEQAERSVRAVPARREPEEVAVPEVTASELLAELKAEDARPPFLLDIREPYERRQGYIPDQLHIPMNSIPSRLSELPGDVSIVVYCAHGNRSYGVTGWLLQQGYTARSLKGGIAGWQARGGTVERG